MLSQRFVTSVVLAILLALPMGVLAESAESHPESTEPGESGEATSNFFDVPSIGYVLEPEALALRPILGTPGASMFGPRLELGVNLRRAWVSPRQSFALAELD